MQTINKQFHFPCKCLNDVCTIVSFSKFCINAVHTLSKLNGIISRRHELRMVYLLTLCDKSRKVSACHAIHIHACRYSTQIADCSFCFRLSHWSKCNATPQNTVSIAVLSNLLAYDLRPAYVHHIHSVTVSHRVTSYFCWYSLMMIVRIWWGWRRLLCVPAPRVECFATE